MRLCLILGWMVFVGCSDGKVSSAPEQPASTEVSGSSTTDAKKSVAVAAGFLRRVLSAVEKAPDATLSEQSLIRVDANRGSIMIDSTARQEKWPLDS